jgi:hypothetical protein
MLSAAVLVVAILALAGTAGRLLAFGIRPLIGATIGIVVAGTVMVALTGYFRAFTLSAGFPFTIAVIAVAIAICAGFVARLSIGFIALAAALAFVVTGFALILAV